MADQNSLSIIIVLSLRSSFLMRRTSPSCSSDRGVECSLQSLFTPHVHLQIEIDRLGFEFRNRLAFFFIFTKLTRFLCEQKVDLTHRRRQDENNIFQNYQRF